MTERRGFLKSLVGLPAAAAVAATTGTVRATQPTEPGKPVMLRPPVRTHEAKIVLDVRFKVMPTHGYYSMVGLKSPPACPEMDDLNERFQSQVTQVTQTPDIYRPMVIHVLQADGVEWGGHLLRPMEEHLWSSDTRNMPYRVDPVRVFRGEWKNLQYLVIGRERLDQMVQCREALDARDPILWDEYRKDSAFPTRLDRREIDRIEVTFGYVV